jgi:putative hemolysin
MTNPIKEFRLKIVNRFIYILLIPFFIQSSAHAMTNPASENCIKLGGVLKFSDDKNGTQGICIFPSGKECEEWALFRGECKI